MLRKPVIVFTPFVHVTSFCTEPGGSFEEHLRHKQARIKFDGRKFLQSKVVKGDKEYIHNATQNQRFVFLIAVYSKHVAKSCVAFCSEVAVSQETLCASHTRLR